MSVYVFVCKLLLAGGNEVPDGIPSKDFKLIIFSGPKQLAYANRVGTAEKDWSNNNPSRQKGKENEIICCKAT